MPWPTPQDYNEAIQNPGYAFADAELAAGTPELTALGLPRPITGNFASVYRMHCGGKDWAVRCFWREYADMRERYEAISRHLAAARLPYTVGFEYVTQGIRIRGTWYPILKMEWVQGELLNEFIERNLSDPAALGRLAERWLRMAAALEQSTTAHGDLQHGNVLVVHEDLKLVDYDAMYVPALAGRGSHEIGHQNYQHPRRTGAEYGPAMDRFSAWVIYVSLRALQAEPTLWKALRGGDECLLLRKPDFVQGSASSAVQLLSGVGDTELRECVARIARFASGELSRVPALESAAGAPWGRAPLVPQRKRDAAAHPRSAARASSISSGAAALAPVSAPVLPAWLVDHVESAAAAQRSFGPPPEAPRLSLLVSVLLLLVLLLAAAASITPPFVLLLPCLLALVAIDGGIVLHGYGREPAVRDMRVLLRDEERELRALRRIERAVRGYEQRLDVLDARLASERVTADRERTALRERERREIESAHDERDTALSECDERLRAVNEAEGAALNRALNDTQLGHVRAHLSRCSLRTSEIPHVGWSLKMRLWAAAVRSAGDLTAEKMRALQWLGEEPLLALAAWRVAAEREARRAMPKSLSADGRTRIVAPFVKARDRIADDRAKIAEDSQALILAIEEHCQRKCAPLDARLVEAERRHREQHAGLERRIEDVCGPAPLHHRRLAEVRDRLQPYDAISLSRYLVHVLVRNVP